MTGDLAQFTSLKRKAEGHVTYGDNNRGDNNRGRILGRGNVVQSQLRMSYMWKN